MTRLALIACALVVASPCTRAQTIQEVLKTFTVRWNTPTAERNAAIIHTTVPMRRTGTPSRAARSAFSAEARTAMPVRVNLKKIASAGRIANLRSDGAGRWTAEYLPPDDTVPQLAIVSALAAGEVGLSVLPLWGQGDAVVKTRPRARIEVQIGSERFPAIADETGIAVVPVNVPPGVHAAKHGSQSIDLHVPPLRLIHVMLDRDSMRADRPGEAQVLLFAVGADGRAREGARFIVHATRGEIGQPRPRAPGVYEATWSFTPGKAEYGSKATRC